MYHTEVRSNVITKVSTGFQLTDYIFFFMNSKLFNHVNNVNYPAKNLTTQSRTLTIKLIKNEIQILKLKEIKG